MEPLPFVKLQLSICRHALEATVTVTQAKEHVLGVCLQTLFLLLLRRNGDAVRAVAENGAFCHIGADGRQREALVALRNPPAPALIQQRLELLLEVVVEKAIDDGVDARGSHSCEVTHREDSIVAPRDGLVVPVENCVEDVQWQPAEGEQGHNGCQHGIDPLEVFRVALTRIPCPLDDVFALTEAQKNAQVTHTDECKRQAVLKPQHGCGVRQPVPLRRPVFYAD